MNVSPRPNVSHDTANISPIAQQLTRELEGVHGLGGDPDIQGLPGLRWHRDPLIQRRHGNLTL